MVKQKNAKDHIFFLVKLTEMMNFLILRSYGTYRNVLSRRFQFLSHLSSFTFYSFSLLVKVRHFKFIYIMHFPHAGNCFSLVFIMNDAIIYVYFILIFFTRVLCTVKCEGFIVEGGK